MTARNTFVIVAIIAVALAGVGMRPVETTARTAPGGQSLAPFVPTEQDVVERMLELAGVTSKDVVYDLGCGDGRIPITVARKYGAHGVGVDIDHRRIAE